MKAVSSFFSSLFGSSTQIKIGDYQVQEEELLSEGGFGFVYRVANVKDPSEKFAMKKLILTTIEQEQEARRQVAIWRALPHHPNIVQFYDMEISTDESGKKAMYILCELCPGGTLFDTLKVIGGPLSEKQTLKVMTDVAMGIQHLHQRDPPIAHRDIKIENIILGKDNFFKLCDFGSATTRTVDFSQELTDFRAVNKFDRVDVLEDIEKHTTFMYRSPQMIDPYLGFKVNEQVDIWMLGCVAFTLLTAKHPFQDQQKLAILNGQYFYPQDVQVSQKMRQFITWLFTHNPIQRPCINEVILALAKWDEHPQLLLSQDERIKALQSQKKASTEDPQEQDFEDFVTANQETDFSSGWAKFK